MIYLAGNNTRIFQLSRAGYPIGLMMSPKGFRRNRGLPFALDNGLFHSPSDPPVGMKGLPPFYAMLDRVIGSPMFVTVPDVPYDAIGTRELSKRHLHHIRGYGFKAALAVQDGMNPDDLDGFDWVFVGGSTNWKLRTLAMWVRESHQRGMGAHVGRVNTWRRINQCIDSGAESCDGTGIFRGDKAQLRKVLESLIQKGLWGQSATGYVCESVH